MEWNQGVRGQLALRFWSLDSALAQLTGFPVAGQLMSERTSAGSHDQWTGIGRIRTPTGS